MDDYGETGQVGCFIDIVFIIVELAIGYSVFTTPGDKTGFIAIILITYFIYKAIRDAISKV